MAKKKIDVIKWIKGMKITQFFEELFKTKLESGEISIQESCAKVIVVINQTLGLWAQYEPIFDSIVSDEGQASADKVKAVMAEIASHLVAIQTIPDIAETLQDYRFADDDERNNFYHSLVSYAAIAFSDGQISLAEGGLFVTQIVLFIKSQND